MVLIVLLLSCLPLYAIQNLALPLDDYAYSILKNAELRGWIDTGMGTKPYLRSEVLHWLRKIEEEQGTSITAQEGTILRSNIARLDDSYGAQADESIFKKGYVEAYNEKLDIGARIGATVELQGAAAATFDGSTNTAKDLRTGVKAYIKGDILSAVSYNMDFKLRYDKLNNLAFHPTEFTIPNEGQYMDYFDNGDTLDEIPFDKFYFGLEMFPEISASLLERNLMIRFGSVKRDWGPGMNNLQIAGTASVFNALEAKYSFTDWLHMSFLTGSLGVQGVPGGIMQRYGNIKGLTPGDTLSSNFSYGPYPSDAISEKTTRYDNNITLQRLELDAPWNLTFGIWESVIWKKRFELGYLNPFTILMFQQNALGDRDDVLAGIDAQWQGNGVRVYGAWAMTEMNSFKNFLKHPRNMMAYQVGADFALPVGAFSTLTVQYTKLDPFFYAHYPTSGNGPNYTQNNGVYEQNYINKGANLGYPLNPNSDELMIHGQFGLTSDISAFATMKYQRRSGQYGFRVDQYYLYDIPVHYDNKNFSANIFEHLISLELGGSYKVKEFPITLNASLQMWYSLNRDLKVTRSWSEEDWDNWNGNHPGRNKDLNPGDTPIPYHFEPTGSWKASLTPALKVGFTLYGN